MALPPELVVELKDAIISASLTEDETLQCLLLVDEISPEHDYRARALEGIERYLKRCGWRRRSALVGVLWAPPKPPSGYTLTFQDGSYEIVQAFVAQLRADANGGAFISEIEVPPQLMARLRTAAAIARQAGITLAQALRNGADLEALSALDEFDRQISAMNPADSLTNRVMGYL